MINLMLRRRTIRKFTTQPIAKEQMEQILSAGLLAPSSMGKRPVELVAVTDSAAIKALSTCKTKGNTALLTAPLVVAVIADSTLSDVWVEDASISATYIFLMAEELGLGCTWVQMRNRQGDTGQSEDMVRELLGIPANLGVLALICIGHPDEAKPPYTKADLPREKLHFGTYGNS